MKNETNLKHFLVSLACVLCVAVMGAGLATGCVTDKHTDPGADIQNYQRQIDALESTVRLYEMRIGQAKTELDRDIRDLDHIRGRAGEAGDTVQELAELFDEYDRAVARLLQDYRELQIALERAGQMDSCISSDTDSENISDDNGLHPLR